MRLFEAMPQVCSTRRFGCFTTHSPVLIRAAQRLRDRVFADELSLKPDGETQLTECDEFDAYCDHLIVYDFIDRKVVGYTRLLNEMQANLAGGFHAQAQFELGLLLVMPGRFLEVGRTCIDPNYRSGAVLSLLWSGLARYAVEGGYNYLFGCVGVPAGSGGFAVDAFYAGLGRKNIAPPALKVKPVAPVPSALRCDYDEYGLPSLLRAYFRLGAWVCGEPHWERETNTMEIFVLLPLEQIKDSYGRRYVQQQGRSDDFHVKARLPISKLLTAKYDCHISGI